MGLFFASGFIILDLKIWLYESRVVAMMLWELFGKVRSALLIFTRAGLFSTFSAFVA